MLELIQIMQDWLVELLGDSRRKMLITCTAPWAASGAALPTTCPI